MSEPMTPEREAELRWKATNFGGYQFTANDVADLLAELDRVRAERDAATKHAEMLNKMLGQAEAALERNGDQQPCYYCDKPCSDLAANPGEWSVALCHGDEPGVVKWHHTGCVMERLHRLDAAEAALREATEWRNKIPDALIGSLESRCQRQLDMDGVFVGVSRQALDELLAALPKVTT